MNKKIWQYKLAAWLHDPAEKALVLFHDPAGHGGGTTKYLLKELNLEAEKNIIQKADWWAAAADRPQWPRSESEGRYAKWSQVDFAANPVLIHPLTGQAFDLSSLREIDFKQVKAVSREHFEHLLGLGGDDDMLKFLALWRFAPEIRAEGFAKLWQLLPADTRTPDHTIWNHLDTVSAIAGANCNDSGVSLLAMSFGPVQSFIAQARSTSDLWAGSHLLSSLVWEAMKAIASEIGPDAFLFPQIRGLAIVDTWLLETAKQKGMGEEWKKHFEGTGVTWLRSHTDANPLFAASLPNKFLALVPKDRSAELAQKAVEAIRKAALGWTKDVITSMLEVSEKSYLLKQLEEQLVGFPHAYWSCVDWPESMSSDNIATLKESYKAFAPEDNEGFFQQPYWQALKDEIKVDGMKFFQPNPGILYPPLYELSERSLASVKSMRIFDQLPQQGFRCTMCGEREWLTDDPEKLFYPPGSREKSIWSQYAGKMGIKGGEHLCAVCSLKRFWPRLFSRKVEEYVEDKVGRYVVSTHTMALAPSLERMADLDGKSLKDVENALNIRGKAINELAALLAGREETVVLPRKLYKKLQNTPEIISIAKRLPAFIDSLREQSDGNENRATLQKVERLVEKALSCRREAYYALIMMDGDNMGAWLAGNEDKYCLAFSRAWHPNIIDRINNQVKDNAGLRNYTSALRSASPGRHAAISQSLNTFASVIAPQIIEEQVNGKLIYSGGDDVLAMVAVDDLLEAMRMLRFAYSGTGGKIGALEMHNGFIKYRDRLYRAMGNKATASIGAVIVHHQTPLAYALKSLREAEKNAKSSGRNAFCIRVLKRGGGEVSFTDSWWEMAESSESENNQPPESSTIELMEQLAREVSANDVSRKAFYSIEDWIHLIPDQNTADPEMVKSLLRHQFRQHKADPALAEKLVEVIWRKSKNAAGKLLRNPLKQLQDMLFTSEFLGRETRSAKLQSDQEGRK